MSLHQKSKKSNEKLLEHLRKRWDSFEYEEYLQEKKYFEHYRVGESLISPIDYFLDYYNNNNPLISYFSWKKINNIVKLVKERVDIKNARILDVGCGAGFFLKKLGPGKNQFGIDISRLFLKHAKIHAPWAKFSRCNVKSLPFDDDYFDMVVCNDVLEHVFYPTRVLKEIDRVAKPGKNKIIISIPNEPLSRIGRMITLRLPIKWIFHIHSLTPAIIKNYIKRKCLKHISVPIPYMPWLLSLERIMIF
ncbi:MAG: class I SAM-dependent methyltransferase [Promethearchaeota archaeon]